MQGKKIPAFIRKLLEIIEDSKFDGVIGWLEDGTGFHIINVCSFTEEVLPNHFKHKNMASFIRQLNMYGFSRSKNSDQHVYFHPKFQRAHLNNMKQIQRKKSHFKKVEEAQEVPIQEEPQSNANQQQNQWQLMCDKLRCENEELKANKERLTGQLKQYSVLHQTLQNYLEYYERRLKMEATQVCYLHHPIFVHQNMNKNANGHFSTNTPKAETPPSELAKLHELQVVKAQDIQS